MTSNIISHDPDTILGLVTIIPGALIFYQQIKELILTANKEISPKTAIWRFIACSCFTIPLVHFPIYSLCALSSVFIMDKFINRKM